MNQTLILLFGGILFFTVSCGSARKGEPIKGPLPISSDSEARGQKVFLKNCHPCHPGGEAGVGPALNNKKLAPWRLVKFQVRHGLGAMPRFNEETISEEDLQDLVAYLKLLRQE